MNERLTISGGNKATIFDIWWDGNLSDLLITSTVDDDTTSRILLRVNSDILQAIADQFYEWSLTLSDNRDISERAKDND